MLNLFTRREAALLAKAAEQSETLMKLDAELSELRAEMTRPTTEF